MTSKPGCYAVVFMLGLAAWSPARGQEPIDPATATEIANLAALEKIKAQLQGSPRQISANFKLQAAGLDPALAGGDERAGRVNWQRLLGAIVGQQQGGGKDGVFYKFEWGPTDIFHLTATLNDPVLRDAVKKAFDDSQEATALSGLQPWDDVLIEAQFGLPAVPKQARSRRASFETAVSDLSRALQERSLQGTLRRAMKSADFERNLKYAVAEVLLQAQEKERPPSALSVRYRSVDELIGQEEQSAALSINLGKPTDISFDSFLEGASTNHRSLAVEGTYVKKRAFVFPGQAALDLKEFEELKVSANASWKAARQQIRIDGINVGIDNSLTLSYIRPNGDFANERIVVTGVFTFPYHNAQSLPVTITWANREELIDAQVIRAHIGISFGQPK